MPKYRPGKIKVQHHVLGQIRAALEEIAGWPEVDGLIPGVIRPKKGPSTGLTLQYETRAGLKLIARSGGAAQEVFVVTGDPAAVIRRLRETGLIPPGPDGASSPPQR